MLAFLPSGVPALVAVRLLNKLLAPEDWAREMLARHAGKTVRFEFGAQKISMAIKANGEVEGSDPAVVPDVTLAISADKLGRLPALLRQGSTDDITALLHIQGDAALAQVVSELARDLRWDAEADLARLVGDVAAVRLLAAAREGRVALRRSARRLAENVSEYLVEESRQVLGRPEFIDWQGRVQAMQQTLLRLEAQMQRVEQDMQRAGAGKQSAGSGAGWNQAGSA